MVDIITDGLKVFDRKILDLGFQSTFRLSFNMNNLLRIVGRESGQRSLFMNTRTHTTFKFIL